MVENVARIRIIRIQSTRGRQLSLDFRLRMAAATLLPDGKLTAAGVAGKGVLASEELCDPVAGGPPLTQSM